MVKKIYWEELEKGKKIIGYIGEYMLFIIEYNDLLSDKEIEEYGGVWLLKTKLPIALEKCLFESIEIAQSKATKLLRIFFYAIK